MNTAAWHLEFLRTVRTPGPAIAVALAALFGAGSPFMALYANEIIAALDPSGTAPAMPDPTPQSSIGTFMDNTVGPLLLAGVLIAALALAFDSRPSRALFHRTRVPRVADLVLPRWTVASIAVCAAYAVGALCAWASTALVLGTVPLDRFLLGTAISCGYLTFVTAVVALSAGLARNVLAVLGIAAGILAATAIAAQIPVVSGWTPPALLGAQVALAGTGEVGDFLPALAATSVLDALCLLLCAWLCSRREF
ncbi:hypothetical protein [Nocardiopsis aegyptia]|uniref:Uncharacterized protein n=1 Tax=Nocardiopsis aegyptia TaxID=220378 RepID=A0A7Z0EPF8_9ACTN|nr:hypothetical protein [Nocardiopsis aegyptia]NYJ35834.1 hypothetical protein [Nocardiopsis aegyptia]